jgi:hypothetical protein
MTLQHASDAAGSVPRRRRRTPFGYRVILRFATL